MSLFGGGGDSTQTSESTTTYGYDPGAKKNAKAVAAQAKKLRTPIKEFYGKYGETGMTPEAYDWWQNMSDVYSKGGNAAQQGGYSALMDYAQKLTSNPMMFFNQAGWSDILGSNRAQQAMDADLQARELEGSLGNMVGALGLGKRGMAESALQGQATREASYQNLLSQMLNAEQQAKQYGYGQLPGAWGAAESFDPESYQRAQQQLAWQNLPQEAQSQVLNQYLQQMLSSYMNPMLNVSSMLYSHPDYINQTGTTETESGGSGWGDMLMNLGGSLLGGVGSGGAAGLAKYLLQ